MCLTSFVCLLTSFTTWSRASFALRMSSSSKRWTRLTPCLSNSSSSRSCGMRRSGRVCLLPGETQRCGSLCWGVTHTDRPTPLLPPPTACLPAHLFMTFRWLDHLQFLRQPLWLRMLLSSGGRRPYSTGPGLHPGPVFRFYWLPSPTSTYHYHVLYSSPSGSCCFARSLRLAVCGAFGTIWCGVLACARFGVGRGALAQVPDQQVHWGVSACSKGSNMALLS